MASVRMILYGVLGVGAAGAVGANHFLGDAKIYVIAPGDESVEIVDAESGATVGVVSAGAMQNFKVSQGKHKFKLKTKADERVVDVDLSSGFSEKVLPLTGQCFVRFNVTDYMYETDNSNEDPLISVKVVDKYKDEPFDLESNTYYLDQGMPDEVKENRDVYTLGGFACDELGASDADLIKAMVGEEG